MNFQKLAGMFNRSLEHLFDIEKFCIVFLVLLFSGLFFLFFYAIGMYAPSWVTPLLWNMPTFIMCFLAMNIGCHINCMYIANKEGRTYEKALFTKESMYKAMYFFLPLSGMSLIFCLLLGLFILIKSIPYIGTFLGIILAFGPFLFNLGQVILFVSSFLLLFYFTPLLSFKKQIDKSTLVKRLQADLFSHFLLLGLAFLPLWIVFFVVKHTLGLTFTTYSASDHPLIIVLQALFILIPVSAIFALPGIFFFNFSVEAFCLSDSKFSQENASDPLK